MASPGNKRIRASKLKTFQNNKTYIEVDYSERRKSYKVV